MKKIKILIPVFNDWQSLFKLLENINNEVLNLDAEFSIIIINDASTETMPAFNLNLNNIQYIDGVKIGVLTGSLLSTIVGYFLLLIVSKKK